jgi:hypothetical protein
VAKTTVDVDRQLAARAAEILGTETLKDTVNSAMLEVVRQQLRRELADDIRAGRLAVPTPAEIARTKEPQIPAGALDRIGPVLRRPRTRRSA